MVLSTHVEGFKILNFKNIIYNCHRDIKQN